MNRSAGRSARRIYRLRSAFSITVVTLYLVATGCSPIPDAVPPESWSGEVTTEGRVTTVRNESGSVWGGTARLVEEASIGVDVGDDPYMLGRPGGIHVAGGRIYVVDQEVSSVNVYDLDGAHLFSFGREGQGPGEFQRPYSIGGSEDGRIFVGDRRNGRVNVYDADGVFLEDYPLGRVQCCGRQMTVTPEGVVYWQILSTDHVEWDPFGFNHPMQAFGPQGRFGELVGPPIVSIPGETLVFDGREMPPPFAPQMVWTVAPTGALIWGTSEAYAFELEHPSGETLVVERTWDPVAVQPAERNWARITTIASLRRSDPEWTWNGEQMPSFKPAFENFIAAHSGELWVVRPGPGVKDPDCDDTHTPDDWEYHSRNWRCWRDQPIIDAFDGEGRYLGEIEVPEGIVLNAIAPPFIRGDLVAAVVYSPDGVIRVKRYRIAAPEIGER